MDYRAHIGEFGALLGYATRVAGNVVNPILIANGVLRRRTLMASIGLFGQLLVFLATGFKLTILSTVALLLLPLALRTFQNSTRHLPIVPTCLTLMCLAIDGTRGSLLAVEIFVDRLLLIPGTLTAGYLMVFDGQPKMLWDYSFMGPFVDSGYATSPGLWVGKHFTGSEDTNANANYIADGFANMGYGGIVLEALFLALILWLLDSVSQGLPLRVAAAVVLIPTISLANSSAFTALLTGGYAAAIVALAVWPRPREHSERLSMDLVPNEPASN